jgi:ABC-type multidrug transport system fused ATPase/permease subunit
MGGIEFENVSLRYAQTPVLDGFTLTVDAGEVVALVGASGTGKTTLLKLVNRLLLPGAGDVRVLGRDTREWIRFSCGARSAMSSRRSGCFRT